MQRHILWVWVSTTLLSAVVLVSLSATSPVEASLGDLIDVIETPVETTEQTSVQDGALEVVSVGEEENAAGKAETLIDDVVIKDDLLLEAIRAAGFTGAEAVVSTDEKFNLPVRYFRVTEGDASGPWLEDANLLAVLIYKPLNQQMLAASPRRVTYVEFAGRYQGRFSKDEYYVAVTGPDLQKVSNLVKLLEGAELEDYEEESYEQKPVVE